MLTLSKLSLLACIEPDKDHIRKVNKEIDLLNYQEDLPENVLRVLGYDPETSRVFLAHELIRVSI